MTSYVPSLVKRICCTIYLHYHLHQFLNMLTPTFCEFRQIVRPLNYGCVTRSRTKFSNRFEVAKWSFPGRFSLSCNGYLSVFVGRWMATWEQFTRKRALCWRRWLMVIAPLAIRDMSFVPYLCAGKQWPARNVCPVGHHDSSLLHKVSKVPDPQRTCLWN